MTTPFFFQVLALSQALSEVLGNKPENAEVAAQSALFFASTMANKGVPLPEDARRRCLSELCALAKSVHINVDDVGMPVVEDTLEAFEKIFLERQPPPHPETVLAGRQPIPSTGSYRKHILGPWKC